MQFHGIELVPGSGIKNFGIEKLAQDPSGVDLWESRQWYNTTDKVHKYYDGTKIVVLGSSEALTNLSNVVDRVKTAAGLEADGTLSATAYTGTNYLDGKTSLVEADKALDTQVKSATDKANDAGTLATKALTYIGAGDTFGIVGSYLSPTEDTAVKALTKLDTELARVEGAAATKTELTDGLATTLRDANTYTDNKVHGLRWKDPVSSMVADHTAVLPVPANGVRILNTTDGHIYTKTADGWDSYVPQENDTVINSDDDRAYTFDSAEGKWVQSSGGANLINAGTGLTRDGNTLNVEALDGTIVVEEDGIKVGIVARANLATDLAKANSGVVFTQADGISLNLGTGIALSAEGVVSVDETHLGTVFARLNGATFTGAVEVPAPTTDAQAARLADVKSAVAATAFEFVAEAPALEHTIVHNLGKKVVTYALANASDKAFVPQDVTFVDENTLKVTLAVAGLLSARVSV